MSIYLEVILWWLIVPTITITASCGIWSVCAHCWREYQAAQVGAGRTRVLHRASSRNIETGADTFPVEWTRRPYDREREAS